MTEWRREDFTDLVAAAHFPGTPLGIRTNCTAVCIMGGAYSCSVGNVVERWETAAVMATGELWTMDLADRVAGFVQCLIHLLSLCRHMAHNSTTRSLVLDRTLTDETVQPFLATLKRNTSLLHLSLAQCGLSPESASRVLGLVRATSALLWVDLSGNHLVPDATLAEIESVLAPRRMQQTPVPLVWGSSIPPPIPLHEEGSGVRILALDGGGMRCLAQLRMLSAIERLTGRPTRELFDLVAVAGLGGTVALSSASLADVRSLLMRISTEVFTSSAIAGALRSNGWYSPVALDQVLSDHFATRPLLQPDAQPFVCVATVSADVIAKPLLLRNYTVDPAIAPQPPRHGLHATAAQAVHAAAATTTYFSPCTIDSHPLVDASPSLGSVAEHALLEASVLWPRAPVKCVVSLGCGPFTAELAAQHPAPPPQRARLAAEASHRRLRGWLQAWQPSTSYVRLDPSTPCAARWDESSPAELAALEAAADAYVASAEVVPVLERLARQLAEGVRARAQ